MYVTNFCLADALRKHQNMAVVWTSRFMQHVYLACNTLLGLACNTLPACSCLDSDTV